MSKNEIGKYVRTEYGYILENTLGGHRDIVKALENKDSHYEFEYGKIVRYSNTLIELVEVGDYINGEKVLEIRQIVEDLEAFATKISKKEIIICVFKSGDGSYYRYIKEAEIKNMLTHERYAQTCYDVWLPN